MGRIEHLVEAQASVDPSRVAVVCGSARMTYAELEARSARVAGFLRSQGVTDGDRVALLLSHSDRLPVAILGVLKAGGVYVPLNTEASHQQMMAMVSDAGPSLILTDDHFQDRASTLGTPVVTMAHAARASTTSPTASVDAGALAYIIYTSGTAGSPKGVMVTHANVLSLFSAMGQVVDGGAAGTWLASTNVAFDIAILELLWPLTVGGTVIVGVPDLRPSLQFSLSYFATDSEQRGGDRYRLLLDGARFADANGFTAVWMPERHFHGFGGAFPNPSVSAAAVAAVTTRVKVRAGSIVLPLHDPLRVAEEWAMVDNLSSGRVGISFASGWHARDFVLAPDRYATRRQMLEGIDTVRRAWRGETIARRDVDGGVSAVRVHPTPVQRDIPCWLTVGQSVEGFREAGRLGFGVLTHLLGQSVHELGEAIAVYRAARLDAGHSGPGHVTLMIHTFIDRDEAHARASAVPALRDYLVTASGLLESSVSTDDSQPDATGDRAQLLEDAVQRFVSDRGLIGGLDSCLARLARLREAGVDEIACLIDFGVPHEQVLDGLGRLVDLRERHAVTSSPGPVTHFQCTPSRLRMLLADGEGRQFLSGLTCLLVGGEPFPQELAAELCALVPGAVWNMYGPTEATVWAMADRVTVQAPVSLGRPLANTSVSVCDLSGEEVAAGHWGELCIAGEGVSAGYRNAPEQTARQFIPDPRTEGVRYRSGDRGRMLPDGRIEFGGRLDDQVKVLGHRVEPGEIETVLVAHPTVKRAVVQLVGSGAMAQWVAHVEVTQSAGAWEHALRQHVDQQLPTWMRPARYLSVDEWPLTSQGKLDRRALIATPLQVGLVAPADTSAMERRLLMLWCEVLRIDRCALDDNFFALGGHSLLAVQLVARLGKALHTAVPLRAIFEAKTPRGLAGWLEDHLTQPDQRIDPVATGSTPEEELVPLTHAQRRIWFLEQLHPDRRMHNMTRTLRVRRHVSGADVEQAVRAMVARHDVLRASFVAVAGVPFQRFRADVDVVCEVIEANPGAIGGFSQRQFVIDAAPLWRVALAPVSPSECLIVIVMHHLVADGHAIARCCHELLEALGLRTPEEIRATRPALRFRDHARLQHEREQRGAYASDVDYWQSRLAGAPTSLALPSDAESETGAESGVRWTGLVLPHEVSASLRELAQRHDATVPAVLLATLGLLMQRLSGQSDVVIGCPAAARLEPDTVEALGCFVNPLPLRLIRDGERTFAEWLATVRDVLFSGLAHQDVPFDRLVQVCRQHGHPPQVPLFQVLFNHLVVPGPSQWPDDVSLEPFQLTEFAGPHDLTLYVFESEASIRLDLAASTQRFGAARLQEMLDQFVALLEQSVLRPDAAVAGYSLLTPRSRQVLPDPMEALERRWAGAVIDRFVRHAQHAPEGLAVVGHERWTYGDLLQRANGLSDALRQSGVGTSDVVAVYADRSADLVVAMLAVHSVGAAFMMLDASHPPARVIDQLGTVEPRAWIQSSPHPLPEALERFLDTRPGVSRLSAVTDMPQTLEPWTSSTRPDDLAYIAFTSGSTGRPLAVRGTHRALSHYLEWQVAHFGMGPTDRTSMLSGVSHDPLLRDVLAPLWSGGAIVVPESAHHFDYLDPRWLREWFARTAISVTHMTPGIGRILTAGMSAADAGSLTELRLVLFAGAPLMHGDVARMHHLAPRVMCVNLYGTTETQLATGGFYVCDTNAPDQMVSGLSSGLPVGTGIDAVQLIVLNEARGQAGVGEVGEVGIRSPYMSEGYHGEAQLTRELFVTSPFTKRPGDRLFRTGDVGRYRLDGSVDLLGRRDRQVKVQGARVDLLEVESAIRTTSGIDDALVTATADEGGDHVLTAYVIGSPADVASLPARMRSRLPNWMWPRHIVRLEAFPLTRSGKIDRAALPKPDPTDPAQPGVRTTGTGADAGSLEARLIDVWRRVLGVAAVGVDDDFFALGGSSLALVELLHEVHALTGLPPDLVTFYREPTVRHLASLLRAYRQERRIRRISRISGDGSGCSIHFVHTTIAQLPLVAAMAKRLPAHLTALSVAAERFDRLLNQTEIEALADRYADELLAHRPDGPYVLAGYSFSGVMAYATAVRLSQRTKAETTVVLLDSHIPPYGESAQEPPYVPARLRGNLVLFKAAEQEWQVSTDPESNGWGQYVDGSVRVVPTPGTHHQVFREPALTVIQQELARLRA